MRLSRVSVTLGSLLVTGSRYLVKRSSSSGGLSLEEFSSGPLLSIDDSSSISGTTWAGSLIVVDKYLSRSEEKKQSKLVIYIILRAYWVG